ncbi:MAG: sulfatase [Anaerolineales bacterium]|nr:sulfatase [Anaerolineales bacterium]
MKAKHNVALIVLDTQRVDRLSCYGYPHETTPNLDCFAKKATRFEYAITPAQWTVPTHASIFTGFYPSQHSLFQMESALPPQVLTLAERLEMGGYKTVGFSHNPLVGQMKNGLNRGFQQFKNYNYLGAGLLTYQLSGGSKKHDVLSRLRTKARSYASELLGYGDSKFFQRMSPLTFWMWKGFLQLSGQAKYAQMRASLQLAIKALQNNGVENDGKPVFTFINLMGVHVPYAPPVWAVSRFVPKHLKKNASTLLHSANNLQVDVKNWLALQLPKEERLAVLNAIYDAEVAGQDAEVGWFLNELERTGLLQNTMVVIVADHGDHLGEKDRLNHAFGVYKELTHVPLLIFDPSGQFSRGAVVRDTISTRRIFHSILSVTGVASTEESQLSLANSSSSVTDVTISEGMPLSWAIKRLEKVRPGIVSELGYERPSHAIFAENYKLIVQGDVSELYRYKKDVNEATNLSNELSREASELKRQLLQLQVNLKPMQKDSDLEEDDEVVLAHLRALGYID